MNNLFNFTSEFLRHSGAVVENKEKGIEVILPANLAALLELDEYSYFVFSSEESKGILVSFDSDVFKKMQKVFLNNKGRFSVVNIPSPPIRIDKLRERIADKIIFNNAVFNVERSEKKNISYLWTFFKFTAFSDERQEGIVSVLINEFNLSTKRLDIGQFDILTDALDSYLENVERQKQDKVLNALCVASKLIVKAELHDFIKSINRRLNRDTQRIYEYYHTLILEIRRFMEKKALTRKEKEQTTSKFKAIDAEFKWKINDLLTKYKMEIHIEPISFIRIETVALVFWLTIRRRKMSRVFPLTYNSLLRTFDALPCEFCFNPERVYSVCDDKLHIVCNKCFKMCPKCGKGYCRACYKTKCPKCGFIISE